MNSWLNPRDWVDEEIKLKYVLMGKGVLQSNLQKTIHTKTLQQNIF